MEIFGARCRVVEPRPTAPKVRLSLGGKQLQAVSFDGTNGNGPDSPAFQSSRGEVVGVTQGGGSVGTGEVASGVVFTLDAGLAAPKARLTVLNPASGSVGSQVAIYGEHMLGTTEVRFNGIGATFQVLNAQTIRATVPTGATTGPITVTNAGGSVVSKKNFTVK